MLIDIILTSTSIAVSHWTGTKRSNTFRTLWSSIQYSDRKKELVVTWPCFSSVVFRLARRRGRVRINAEKRGSCPPASPQSKARGFWRVSSVARLPRLVWSIIPHGIFFNRRWGSPLAIYIGLVFVRIPFVFFIRYVLYLKLFLTNFSLVGIVLFYY